MVVVVVVVGSNLGNGTFFFVIAEKRGCQLEKTLGNRLWGEIQLDGTFPI